jgi:alpha-glucosidase
MPDEAMMAFEPIASARLNGSGGSTLRLETDAGEVALTIWSEACVRVSLASSGAPEHRSWSVVQPEPAALPPEASVVSEGQSVTISLAGMIVTVDLDDARFTFARPGEEPFTVARLGRCGTRLAWQSDLVPGERIFAGGQRTGPLDKRGRRLSLWATDPVMDHDLSTDPMYQPVPIAVMLRGGRAHGLFLDTSYLAAMDLGSADDSKLMLNAEGPDLVVYVFAGPDLAHVLEHYTALTGRMPSLPRWSLGYQQSRWSYETADEVRAIASGMREHDIPCDAIYLDIDYMDGFRDFTWNAAHFPDPAGLIRELSAQGIRLVTIVDPGVKVDLEYAIYREGHERGYFVRDATGQEFQGWVWPGLSAWADFARDDVRAWWGALSRGLTEAGVAGIWNDMNEPTQTKISTTSEDDALLGATLPLDAQHGDPDHPIPHAAFHNVYGMEMTRATRSGLEALRPDARPFVLTRATWAGGQRYAAVWNGDNSSIWPHLRLAVTMNLGLGLAGFPMTGCDIGGFWHDTTPELLVRFTQIGALLPFCRNHSAKGTIHQEPWAFGEPYASACRDAIRLRYQLLPLLVSLAHEASATGAPIVRPLCWLDPDCACDDEFLLGNDLLAAPVLTEGATERDIVLPAGVWIDWWTGESYQGPGAITLPVTLESLPLLQRAGSIVPLAGVVAHTGAPATEPLALRVALAAPQDAASLAVWDDDDSPDAEARGAFADYRISATWADDTIAVRCEQAAGQMPLRYPGMRVKAALPAPWFAIPQASRPEIAAALPAEWRFDVRRG